MSEQGDQPVEIHVPLRALKRGKMKVAFSLKELVALTSTFSLKWAKGCDSQVIRTDPKKYLLVYRVTCHKKDSNPAGHVVRLKFDFNRMKQTGTVDDLDVRVTCSCPAFLFWGGQWNLSTGDALYGAPRPKFQPPTDPRRYQNLICKHVKIVYDRIGPVLERMLAKHQNAKDKVVQEQSLKDVELEKQRTQQTIEELENAGGKLPGGEAQPPIPEEEPESELLQPWKQPDTDLGDLTLPHQRTPGTPRPNPENLLPQSMRDFLKLPPAPAPAPAPTPKKEEPASPAPPAAPPVAQPAEQPKPEAPSAKGKLVDEFRASEGRKVTPNLTVYDDDDDSTTVVTPSPRGKLVRDFTKSSQAEPAPSKPSGPEKVVRDETTSGRPLPPNITLVDDDDDSTTRINSSLRRMMAALRLASEEEEPAVQGPGRLGGLVATPAPTSEPHQ